MAELSTYAKRVEYNLRHMGTSKSEWNSIPVIGTQEAIDGKGNPVEMPIFQFPQGYAKAPTLYPNIGGFGSLHCELCSKEIKNAFHIQNDAKKWTLTVGSECVKHFGEGESGEKIAKKDIAEINRDFIRTLDRIRDRLWEKATYDQTYRAPNGAEYKKRVYASHIEGASRAIRFYSALCSPRQQGAVPMIHFSNLGDFHEKTQVIKEIPTAKLNWNGDPAFTDRQISNWLKKHRPAAERFLQEVTQAYPGIDKP